MLIGERYENKKRVNINMILERIAECCLNQHTKHPGIHYKMRTYFKLALLSMPTEKNYTVYFTSIEMEQATVTSQSSK
jgi:hypothetical protein